jgi:putative addiction module component (TIGR02574 family)
MEFLVTLFTDEDGVWIVECPTIPGCVSQGATRVEALDNVREAIALCLEVWEERRGAADVEVLWLDGPAGSPGMGIDFRAAARRFELAQDLWDGMDPAISELPLTPAMEALLDERLAELERNPDAGEPWEVVRDRIALRLREGATDVEA